FLGFGGYRLAQEMEFMPQSLISLFSRVLWEEARHIVFFVNWIAYERVQRGYGGSFVQAVATAIGYIRAVLERIISGRSVAENATEPLELPNVGLIQLLYAGLSENERLMAQFDPRLLRPRVVPTIAQVVINAAETGENIRGAFAPRAS
ncbi:MAG: hypothetical protein ACREML_05010, partial [Vulcanimicrobiaceae bacterium]